MGPGPPLPCGLRFLQTVVTGNIGLSVVHLSHCVRVSGQDMPTGNGISDKNYFVIQLHLSDHFLQLKILGLDDSTDNDGLHKHDLPLVVCLTEPCLLITKATLTQGRHRHRHRLLCCRGWGVPGSTLISPQNPPPAPALQWQLTTELICLIPGLIGVHIRGKVGWI